MRPKSLSQTPSVKRRFQHDRIHHSPGRCRENHATAPTGVYVPSQYVICEGSTAQKRRHESRQCDNTHLLRDAAPVLDAWTVFACWHLLVPDTRCDIWCRCDRPSSRTPGG